MLESPTMIQLESSTVCDGKCVFCHRPQMNRKGGTMARWVFEKILEEAVKIGITEIVIFLCGEPFLFPDIFVWLQRLREEKRTTAIFTNGANLSKDKADILATYSDVVHTVIFSLCGMNSETHNQMMGLDHDIVKSNVEYFVSKKPPEMKAVAHIPRMSLTHQWIDDWADYWRPLLDSVGATPMMNYAGLLHDELELAENEEHSRYYCGRLDHATIHWNGDMVLCCWDIEATTVLGNVKNKTIKEIFNSTRARHFRYLHRHEQFDCVPLCIDCNANILNKVDIERKNK